MFTDAASAKKTLLSLVKASSVSPCHVLMPERWKEGSSPRREPKLTELKVGKGSKQLKEASAFYHKNDHNFLIDNPEWDYL